MNPRFGVAKRPRLGKIVGMSPPGTPNHEASVAEYWSTETEGIHTPFLSDRDLAVENAIYVFGGASALAGDLEFAPGGIVERRASQVLEECRQMLQKVAEIGFFAAIEAGMFADTVRTRDGGKGLDGVIERGPDYFNPIAELLAARVGVDA